MMETQTIIRAAVYTRKSSEEGLEQEFNSLDAKGKPVRPISKASRLLPIHGQAALRTSLCLKHESWLLVDKEYSDGGISGGTLNRPAVQELLQDIKAGLVNMIVVYKIDRLTRSLHDFSKLVEIFDKTRNQHGQAYL